MAKMDTNDIEVDAEVDTSIEEATASADTLKPGAGSGTGDSKAETLATFTNLLAQLGKEDLSNLFNRTLEQIGKEAANTPGSAEANRSSVAAKPSSAVGKGAWKEDIDDMFAGDELSEELKNKAEVVFEAAVNARMTLETVKLEESFEAAAVEMQEHFDVKLAEEAASIFEELTGKLDQYLDYVIEQWMEENVLAVETSLRADIAENFIQGLHNLFAENYIRVPDEKIDLVAELKAELDETKNKLSETIDNQLELQKVIDEALRESAIDQVTEGLVETQVEKLRTLAEGIEYTDMDSFAKKLNIVKENYFSSTSKAPVSTGLITEEIGSDSEEHNDVVLPANMKNYMQAITKAAKS